MCTILRDIVRDSIELQYIIELAADGMVDGIGCNLSTAERLARLLQLRARWRSLEWTRVITISTPVSFQQCVVDGVYASMPEVDNPSRRLTLTCLSSNGDVEVPRVLQMEDTEENIHAFALDPSQNLVVLLLEEDPLVYVFRSYEVRIATHTVFNLQSSEQYNRACTDIAREQESSSCRPRNSPSSSPCQCVTRHGRHPDRR